MARSAYRLVVCAALGLTAGGCGAGTAASADVERAQSAELTGVDADHDGIDDGFEDALAARYAPVVKLGPGDWTRPANVDWYLARVHMRFDHSGCPDHQILALGTVTQANLGTQSHPTTNWYCGHTSTVYSSSARHLEFFLQPPDDAVHSGLSTPGAWRTYVHVKPSVVVSGGYDVQYWFFYAYDVAVAGFNHEADWEHITVSVDASGAFQSAWYAKHDTGERFTAAQLSWFEGTHPVVYSADGTHASYPAPGSWDAGAITDTTEDGGPIWQTWNNLVNVGERGAPLNGQKFIQYGGRWGEVGEFEFTSGPPTPSVQGAWNKY